MQRRSSIIRRSMRLCAAIVVFASGTAAAQSAPDLTGTWASSTGLSYTIALAGNQYVWTDSTGIRGNISITRDGVLMNWIDAAGPRAATGTFTERDASGQPTRIAWSNGAVFQRQSAGEALLVPPQRGGSNPVESPDRNRQVQPVAPAGVLAPMATVLSQQQGTAATSGTADDLAATMRVSSITALAGRLPQAIPVRSVRVAVQSQADPTLTSSGAAAGMNRPQFSAFSVTKAIDLTSPELMGLAVTGTLVPEVTVELFDRKINQRIVLWRLTDVIVVVHDDAFNLDGGAGRGSELVSLKFSKIELQVNSYDQNGVLAGTSKRGWDLVNNQEF